MTLIDNLKDANGHISKENIMKVLPYNEHFLFVDEIISLDRDKVVAKKKITGKEDFLKGHFVGFPITPGVLIVEGVGQAATLLARYTLPDQETKDLIGYKVRDAKFTAPVLPGDEMTYEVVCKSQTEKFVMMQGKVFVEGKQTGDMLLMIAIVDRKRFRDKYSTLQQTPS